MKLLYNTSSLFAGVHCRGEQEFGNLKYSYNVCGCTFCQISCLNSQMRTHKSENFYSHLVGQQILYILTKYGNTT